MSKKNPVTSAIRYLNQRNIQFYQHQYEYEEKGGTRQTAIELNIAEHSVIKTLVFICEKQEIIVLIHGDKEVSVKELARQLNVKQITLATADVAIKATGYQFGGTSPFGTYKQLPIYVEETIFFLDKIYINGGKRGFILEIPTEEFKKAITYQIINVAINK